MTQKYWVNIHYIIVALSINFLWLNYSILKSVADVLSSAITKFVYSFWAIPHRRCIFFARCCVSSAEKKTVQIKIRHSSHELILIKCYQNSSCKSFLIWITPLYDLKMLWYFKIIVASFLSLSLPSKDSYITWNKEPRQKINVDHFPKMVLYCVRIYLINLEWIALIGWLQIRFSL